MKKSLQTFLTLFVFLLLSFSFQVFSQQPSWKYISEVKFPPADSNKVQPYLCTVDVNGRLWVISSKATNSKAHNAIYFADSTDNQLKKFIDFDNNGDSDTLTGNIGALRGIGTIGNWIIVNASIPYQRTAPNTVASMYVYKNRDTLLVDKFGFGITGAGYGTYIHGVAISNDTIVFSSTTATATGPGPAPRLYNFSYARTTPARGSWISATYQIEIGGAHSAGVDVIRDLALIPDSNYNDPEIPFYTSRNSKSATETTGGIAIWSGGTQNDPGSYSNTRVSDAANDLTFDKAIPYGITVDKDGNLWVAGVDSTRRWVKAYSVLVNFASQVAALPSLNDPNNPDPQGAPFINPNDVALTKDALTAYVTDGGNKTVYKFKFTSGTGINDKIELTDFQLNQNYPNPFNPATIISYTLQQASDIRLIVTNSLGEEVGIISEGYHEAGKYVREFKGNNLSSGIYYYTLITEAGRISKKMVLMK
jgi:hypothetical protein